jgi:hypothetical protein
VHSPYLTQGDRPSGGKASILANAATSEEARLRHTANDLDRDLGVCAAPAAAAVPVAAAASGGGCGSRS